ncbi:hypothetical protein AVEN_192909-1 [Araneus ventricosus]|uniref:Uncharacterized protein n=1 Tax=Araneus ventricosus TaxID=182803 RepID=A0A4Y2JMZ8_ARAVE|nr:hypothetical protein AVEN_192909-1 [Araneus ventricosus]
MHTKRKLCRNCRSVAFRAECSFRCEMLSRIENEHDFLNHINFSDEATFHVGNKVNMSTITESGAQKIPMQYRKWKETVQKSMCCALLHDTVIGQFVFARLL